MEKIKTLACYLTEPSWHCQETKEAVIVTSIWNKEQTLHTYVHQRKIKSPHVQFWAHPKLFQERILFIILLHLISELNKWTSSIAGILDVEIKSFMQL